MYTQACSWTRLEAGIAYEGRKPPLISLTILMYTIISITCKYDNTIITVYVFILSTVHTITTVYSICYYYT